MDRSAVSDSVSVKTSAKTCLILVTGGTGYLGSHIIEQLAKEGHQIRATVRNLDDKPKQDAIRRVVKNAKWPVEFFAADFLEPTETWKDAFTDCDVVIHAASLCAVRELEEGISFVKLLTITFYNHFLTVIFLN